LRRFIVVMLSRTTDPLDRHQCPQSPSHLISAATLPCKIKKNSTRQDVAQFVFSNKSTTDGSSGGGTFGRMSKRNCFCTTSEIVHWRELSFSSLQLGSYWNFCFHAVAWSAYFKISPSYLRRAVHYGVGVVRWLTGDVIVWIVMSSCDWWRHCVDLPRRGAFVLCIIMNCWWLDWDSLRDCCLASRDVAFINRSFTSVKLFRTRCADPPAGAPRSACGQFGDRRTPRRARSLHYSLRNKSKYIFTIWHQLFSVFTVLEIREPVIH